MTLNVGKMLPRPCSAPKTNKVPSNKPTEKHNAKIASSKGMNRWSEMLTICKNKPTKKQKKPASAKRMPSMCKKFWIVNKNTKTNSKTLHSPAPITSANWMKLPNTELRLKRTVRLAIRLPNPCRPVLATHHDRVLPCLML